MDACIENAHQESADDCGTSTKIRHIREIRVNYRGPKLEPKTIRSAEDAVGFIRKVMPDNSREHFIVLFLDGSHQIVSYAVAFTGTGNSCLVHPREVFQRAVLVGAIAIVASHNHPSGNSEPSEEDRAITVTLKKAGECLGIKLLDHIIVGFDSHYSFCAMGDSL
jgi:DNA repair protein RadC